jgi:hypothetical protein
MKKEEIYVVIDSEPKRLRAIHKLRYYKEPIFSLSDIFSENPYNKCLEFYDDEWIVLGYDDKDIKKKTEISLDQLDQMLNPQFVVKDVILPIEELQKQAELLGWKLVKEERQIKVGDFGKFWDSDESSCFFGFVSDLEPEHKSLKYCLNDDWFANFAHLTEEEKQQIQENW